MFFIHLFSFYSFPILSLKMVKPFLCCNISRSARFNKKCIRPTLYFDSDLHPLNLGLFLKSSLLEFTSKNYYKMCEILQFLLRKKLFRRNYKCSFFEKTAIIIDKFGSKRMVSWLQNGPRFFLNQ